MSDQKEEGKQSVPSPPAPPPDPPSSSSDSDVSEVILWKSDNEDSSGSGDSEAERLETAKSLLSFSSANFSPILALKCRDPVTSTMAGSVPVVPMAPPPSMEGEGEGKKYLNLQQWSKAIQSPSKSPRKNVVPIKQLTKNVIESTLKKQEAKPGPSAPVPSTSMSATTTTTIPHYPIPGRRFLPHQMPVYRPRKEHPNTLTLMATAEGPQSALKRVMGDRIRVKIWTRNEKGFRGFLTGFVEAFDKHWNLSLKDVDEQFVRRRVIKFPISGDNIIPGDEEEDVEMEDCQIKKENKRKAISTTFIRLQNYLRQNEVKKGMSTFTTTTSTHTLVKKSAATASRGHGHSSSRDEGQGERTEGRSKTVYVGDMDPLAICRAGLAKLSLCDDVDDHHIIHQEKDSFKSSRKKTAPDVVQCHQITASSSSSAPTSSTRPRHSHPPPPVPAAVPTIHQQTSSTLLPSAPGTRTSLKKKSLTVFKRPYEDNFGFMVVAQTKKYELVERHVGQVLLMGNDIVFIETSGGCC